MPLPPGPKYLICRAHYAAAPPALIYALTHVINAFYNIQTPLWLLILGSVLAYPVAFVIHVQYTCYVDEREAQKHGAVLPPRIPDNSIGSMNSLALQVSAFKEGYIGDIVHQWCEQLGNTINVRVLFENRVCFIQPNSSCCELLNSFR